MADHNASIKVCYFHKPYKNTTRGCDGAHQLGEVATGYNEYKYKGVVGTMTPLVTTS